MNLCFTLHYSSKKTCINLMYSCLFSSVTLMSSPPGFKSWCSTLPSISKSVEKNNSRPHSSRLLSLKPSPSKYKYTHQFNGLVWSGGVMAKFNGPLPRTTRVSWYQKDKINLDLLKQETASGSGISWAICKSAPRPREITTLAPHHSVFYRLDALPAAQQLIIILCTEQLSTYDHIR